MYLIYFKLFILNFFNNIIIAFLFQFQFSGIFVVAMSPYFTDNQEFTVFIFFYSKMFLLLGNLSKIHS
jgi:hypothetical protein